MNQIQPAAGPLAYTIPAAASACGTSETILKEVIGSGDLRKKYIRHKPVLLATDLQEWLESLPEYPPSNGRAT